MVFRKLIGLLLVMTGLYFVIALPGIGQISHMPESFARVTILIGLILTGVGIFLMVKG